MIKIENTDVNGFEAAIRGMRNSHNSWDKSDSHYLITDDERHGDFIIGEEDLKLMKKLILAGTDHSKFMRMINVTCDITAPLYWWKEMDTYKVGTVRNSCSTMHTIAKKEFTLDDYSHEHLSDYSRKALYQLIDIINGYRNRYIVEANKEDWWQMIQLLPSSYNQRATVQLNYAVLRSIRNSQRKTHKLDEWRVGFMEWIESLPYSELITIRSGIDVEI